VRLVKPEIERLVVWDYRLGPHAQRGAEALAKRGAKDECGWLDARRKGRDGRCHPKWSGNWSGRR